MKIARSDGIDDWNRQKKAVNSHQIILIVNRLSNSRESFAIRRSNPIQWPRITFSRKRRRGDNRQKFKFSTQNKTGNNASAHFCFSSKPRLTRESPTRKGKSNSNKIKKKTKSIGRYSKNVPKKVYTVRQRCQKNIHATKIPNSINT